MFKRINKQRTRAAPAAESTGSSFSFGFDLEHPEPALNSAASALAAASTPSGPFNIPSQRTNKDGSSKPKSSLEILSVNPVSLISPEHLSVETIRYDGNFLDFAGPGVHILFHPRAPIPTPRKKKRTSKKAVPPALICGVPQHQVQSNLPCDWALGVAPFEDEDFDDEDEVPDMSVDPESHVLTVFNPTDAHKAMYISLAHPYRCFNKRYEVLAPALSAYPAHASGETSSAQRTSPVTTLVLLVPPRTVIDACYVYMLREPAHAHAARLCHLSSTDVSLLRQHECLQLDGLSTHLHSHVTAAAPPLAFPLPTELHAEQPLHPKHKPHAAKQAAAPQLLLSEAGDLWHPLVPVVGFPLPGGPYLVTQAAGGCLTHSTAQTRHAVDLACPRGTPVLAVADAEVVAVRDGSKCQGAHTANLFEWNSILLRVSAAALTVVGEGPVPPKSLYVEYVHLSPESVCVRAGDRVCKGQQLALSGAAGFCPQPHLHIQVQASLRDDASTVPFAFAVEGGASGAVGACVPAAGTFLSAQGPVETAEAGKWMGNANVITESSGGMITEEDVYCEGGRLPYWAASIVSEFLGVSD